MQVKGEYDLLVIGDQLSGLFLAAGAAQAGLRVLVLEGKSTSSVYYEIPSGKFLGDVTAEPTIGLQENSKVDLFLKSLGLYQNVEDLFRSHQPAMQFLTPRKRIEFSYQVSELEKELERELFSHENVKSFAEALLGKLVSKKKWSEIVADLNLPLEFEKFGSLQASIYGSILPEIWNYSSYKQVMDLASLGVRYPMGGRSALKELLMARIQVFGGTIKRGTRVEEIVFEKGKLAGALLSSYEGFVRSSMVIGAMGGKTFYELLPREFRSKKLHDYIQKIQPSHWRLSFTLIIPENILPEGMGSNLIYIDPDQPSEEESFLHLQVFDKAVYSGIPGGNKALVVRLLMPLTEKSLEQKSIEKVLKRSVTRLQEIIPFLEEEPYSIFPNPKNLSNDLIFQKVLNHQVLEQIAPIRTVYASALCGEEFSSRLTDWKEFGLEGIALCSRDIRPYLGLLGEIHTAMELLALLQKRAKS